VIATVDVDRLVDDLADVVPGAVRAVLASADGLPVAVSTGVPAALAEQLSAIAAGMAALTRGAADLLDTGQVHHTTVEMTQGVLVLRTFPDGSHLVVLTIHE
jgi:predicted regulator of Ras-like GTPase activity (Roadblock/LC7/MglB family)